MIIGIKYIDGSVDHMIVDMNYNLDRIIHEIIIAGLETDPRLVYLEDLFTKEKFDHGVAQSRNPAEMIKNNPKHAVFVMFDQESKEWWVKEIFGKEYRIIP